MFGKKKKQAKVEEQQPVVAPQEEVEQLDAVLPMQEADNGKIYFESEIIEDDDDSLPVEYESIAYILKQETGEDLLAQPVDDEVAEPANVDDNKEEEPVAPVVQPTLEEVEPTLEEVEDVAEDVVLEEVEEEVVEDEPQNVESTPVEKSDKEEVVYVVDGPSEDDDELVKPAKLVKLPNLVDYMLSQNMSKKMKMNIATLLLSAYNKYKDIPEEKKIVIQCMAKVMRSLIQG